MISSQFLFCVHALVSYEVIVLVCNRDLNDFFFPHLGRLYQCNEVGGNSDYVEERHRHRYEVNPDHVSQLEKKGMMFVGHSTDDMRMEIMELKGKP